MCQFSHNIDNTAYFPLKIKSTEDSAKIGKSYAVQQKRRPNRTCFEISLMPVLKTNITQELIKIN